MEAERKVPKRVLLVDDDGVTRSVLARLLAARGYEVIEAENGATALRELNQGEAPRLAVVDWNMGTINGPELCRILRGRPPYVYVVLTTAREGRKPLIEAMNAGADGYIQKPVDADELEAWLVAGQRIVDLQDRLMLAQAELERRATHDALTGVRNRASLLEILGREVTRTVRTKTPTGVVLFDIDHFKNVNDTHGHAVGDEVLVEFAARCQRAIREYDVFGRYGGEEFLLILPSGSVPEAAAVASRLLRNVVERPFKTAAGEISISASAGVASTGQGYLDSDVLVGAADAGLYQAKDAGRGCVRLGPDSGEPDSERFAEEEARTLRGD